MLRNVARSLFAIFLTLLLVNCGGGDDAPGVPTTNGTGPSLDGISSIVVFPQAIMLQVGKSVQLKATGTYSDGSQKDVSKSVDWIAVGDASVSSSGLVTATNDGAVSGAVVTAKVPGSSSIAGSAIVHVSLYGTDGTAAQPVVLTPEKVFNGQVNTGGPELPGYSYYAVNLTPGDTYYVTVSKLVDYDVALEVFADAAYSQPLCSVSYYEYIATKRCAAQVPANGALYIRVDGDKVTNSADGTSYEIIVQKGYGDEGQGGSPVPVTVGVPYSGQVGNYSKYVVSLQPTARYTFTLSGMTDDVDLDVMTTNSEWICSSNTAGLVNEQCGFQAEFSPVEIWVDGTKAPLGAGYTLTVTEDHAAYVDEGTLAAPLNLAGLLPYTGQSVAASYYVLPVTAGKSYEITHTAIDPGSNVIVYADAGFTTKLCDTGYGTTSCRIEPAPGGNLYLMGDGNGLGVDYVIDVQAIVYAAEGTAAIPTTLVAAPPLDTPYAGQVDAGASYYQVPNITAGATYHIGLANLSGDVGLQVYGDAAMSVLLCSSNNAALADEACTTAPNPSGSSLWVKVTGASYGSRFDLSVDRVYFNEGSEAAPQVIPLGTYQGQVAKNGPSVYQLNLTPGKSYVVNLSNKTAEGGFNVYEDSFWSLSCIQVATCAIHPSETGVAYVEAWAPMSNFGMGFTVNVQEEIYQSEGTLAAPLALLNFPVSDGVATVPSVRTNGEVGNGSSYYVVDISGGYDYVGYRVSANNLSLDANLYVYSDPAFSSLLCSSTQTGTVDESCAFNYSAGNQLYIRVDGTPSGAGALYELVVDHDYLQEGTPVTGNGGNATGGALALALHTPHQGEAPAAGTGSYTVESYSYYQFPVVAGTAYTVTLSNLFDSACMDVYTSDDGTFTSYNYVADSNMGLATKSVAVTPTINTLYLRITGCNGTGSAYTLQVD
ncbi:MAG TPA: hypothetical protein VGE00_03485 [Gammaproteobacteria bacterium]